MTKLKILPWILLANFLLSTTSSFAAQKESSSVQIKTIEQEPFFHSQSASDFTETSDVFTNSKSQIVSTSINTGSTQKQPISKDSAVTASQKKDSTNTSNNSSTQSTVKALDSSSSANNGLSSTNSAHISVEPFSGSANFTAPISVPPGRGGIQPNISLMYSSTNRQIGNAGVGWNLDFGSIQRSLKKGIPTYDDTKDTFAIVQGSSQDLLKDPTSNRYYPEVEGVFSKIEYFTNYWRVTDKKGTQYYFGNTDDSRQYDPANPSHIFRWCLNRVEDLNGNYMTITYTKDNGQIYPNVIQYTGNDKQALNPFVTITINYGPIAYLPSTWNPEQANILAASGYYSTGFMVNTIQRIYNISVKVNNNLQSTYTFNYVSSPDTQRDLLQSITQKGSDGVSSLPPISFTYQTNAGIASNYSLISSFNSISRGDNIWNAQVSGGFDRGSKNFGPLGPQYFDVDSWQRFSETSGSWGGGSWNSDNQAQLIFSSSQDCANIYYTYLYVSSPKTITVPYTNTRGDIGVYLNGNYSTNVGHTWNLVQGYNLVVITAYDQSGSFNFNLNYPLNSNVDYVSSSQSVVPQISGDFNGDGKMDMATYSAADGSVKVYLSNGSTFAPPQTWITGINVNGGVLIVGDFNGDGLSDLVAYDPTTGNWRVLLSNGTQFMDKGFWITSFGIQDIHSGTITPGVGDFNGDGISDIYYYGSNGNPNTTGLMHFALTNNSQFQALSNTSTFAFVDCPESAVDINGDGLSDIVVDCSANGYLYAWRNQGINNNKISLLQVQPYIISFGTGKPSIISDFRNSGVNEQVGYFDQATSRVYYTSYLGGFYDSFAGVYPLFYKTLDAALPAATYQVQSVDINGDGINDLVFYDSQQNVKTYLSNEKYPNLLSTLNNGVGGVTTIAYDSSANYQNKYMPFAEPVVKSVTTSDSLGHSYTTTYKYADGLYDPTYREFDGFGTVKVVDADGNYSQTTFLQDHWQRGHPIEQDAYDTAGNLYSKTINQWQTQNIATNNNQTSKFVYLSRTDNYLYDGTTTAKRTAQEFSYAENPQYGDPTQSIDYGEVDPDSGIDAGVDKVISQVEYINNTDAWVLGLPKHSFSTDSNGTIIGQNWFYYDGSSNNSATPSMGRLTKKVDWLGDAAGIQNPQTLYFYDNYGNLQVTHDPKGNITGVAYDSTYHMFPVTTVNMAGQKSYAKYYGIDDTLLDDGKGFHGLWGQTKSITDTNNQTSSTVYDIFGRALMVISPLDSIAFPTTQKIYQTYSTYSSVITKARINSGAAQTIDTVSYYDGLGRLIENKSLGPNVGQYIVSGQTEYDERGLPTKSYESRFTTNDLNTMDAIDTTVPNSQLVHDAMGRVIKNINPDGSYSNIIYDHWTSTTFDPNGHMEKSYADARGHLIQKEEYLGADGRDANYPSNPYTLYTTTSYGYDLKGNLTSVMDAHHNGTTVKYDNLGRKISMDDPDMGHWTYSYDVNGNLLSQTDPKGQKIQFTYDPLNRLINKGDSTLYLTIGSTSNQINPASDTAANLLAQYQYDDVAQTFSKERLTSVSYGNDKAGFFYDQLGRETGSIKSIDGSNYTVSRSYDDLNRLKQLQYPDRTQVNYVYNQSGQISSMNDGTGVTNYIKHIDYNATGSISQIQYGNGVSMAYVYDPLTLRLKHTYSSNGQGAVEQDLTYNYDSVGQILNIQDKVNTNTQTFKYDELNRLIYARGSYGTKTYTYDEIGNIIQKDGLTYHYGESGAGPHAVTSLSNGYILKYDINGNMISVFKPGTGPTYTPSNSSTHTKAAVTYHPDETTKYIYDSQNRLTAVYSQSSNDAPILIAQYAYDGDGGRVKKTVYRRDKAVYNSTSNIPFFQILDPTLPATTMNTTTDITKYVGNLYEQENNRVTKFIYLGSERVAAVTGTDIMYYHADNLGGNNILTDKTGLVRELTEYEPFGQIVRHEKYGNNFATAWYYFTGKPLDDETGLMFYGARYYNPSLGRFISADTIIPGATNSQNFNRYSYCGNNPINFIDPTGHGHHHDKWKQNGGFLGHVESFFEDVGIVLAGAALFAISGGVLTPVIGVFWGGVVQGAIAGAAIGGFTAGVTGGDIGQGLLTGAIGGAIFGVIGGFHLDGLEQELAHAAGGAASGAIDGEISGGNVRLDALTGGISAGVSEWAGESISLFKFTGNYITDVVKQAALGGILGGGTSAAFGGNFLGGFENGAEMSAIGYTSNDWVHNFSQSFSHNLSGYLQGIKMAGATTSILSFALGVVAFGTGFGEVAATALVAGRFFGGLSTLSAFGQAYVDKNLREGLVAGFSTAVSTATEGVIGNSSIYGQSMYLHESATSVSGEAAGQTSECFANGKC